MKTDRELIELAAKAATIEITRFQFDGDAVVDGQGKNATAWNPIKYDSDALRLAVRLRLCVSVEYDAQVAWWCGDSLEQVNESLGNDEFSATRRAIVRAAAAIGENLP